MRFDSSYNNRLDNPYSSGAGPASLKLDVIAWSLGPDGEGAAQRAGAGDKATGVLFDDVVTW